MAPRRHLLAHWIAIVITRAWAQHSYDPLVSARAFSECMVGQHYRPHWTEVVIDQRGRFVYINNHKASSTTIKTVLQSLGAVWNADSIEKMTLWKNKSSECDATAAVCMHKTCIKHSDHRTTTECLDARNLKDYVVFTWVREPVSKFMSGLGQMVRMCKTTKTLCSSREHEKVLRRRWVDGGFGPEDHTATNAWRSSSTDRHGKRIPLNFIGRVEHFDEDIKRLADLLGDRLSPKERTALLKPTHARSGATGTAYEQLNVSAKLMETIRCLPNIVSDYKCLETVYRRPAVMCQPPPPPPPSATRDHYIWLDRLIHRVSCRDKGLCRWFGPHGPQWLLLLVALAISMAVCPFFFRRWAE